MEENAKPPLAGDWSGMQDKLRKSWGKLTDEDISAAGGKRDLLLERIRERYGLGPDEAEKQLQDWASGQDGEPGEGHGNKAEDPR